MGCRSNQGGSASLNALGDMMKRRAFFWLCLDISQSHLDGSADARQGPRTIHSRKGCTRNIAGWFSELPGTASASAEDRHPCSMAVDRWTRRRAAPIGRQVRSFRVLIDRNSGSRCFDTGGAGMSRRACSRAMAVSDEYSQKSWPFCVDSALSS